MTMLNKTKPKTKPTKTRITILASTILIMLVMVTGISSGEDLTLPWYPVEEWEVATCIQDQAEYTVSGDNYDAGEAVNLDLFSHQVIVTLQAEIQEILPDNRTVILIGWYVQPIMDEATFEVKANYAFDPNNFTPPEIIESGSATAASGYYGYKVLITEPENKIENIELYVSQGPVQIIIPIE
jgi:hypothetical protein